MRVGRCAAACLLEVRGRQRWHLIFRSSNVRMLIWDNIYVSFRNMRPRVYLPLIRDE